MQRKTPSLSQEGTENQNQNQNKQTNKKTFVGDLGREG